MEGVGTRREFLRLAVGATAAVAATGAGCGGSSPRRTAAVSTGSTGGRPVLRVALWSHFIPGYDAWFDGEYVRRWSEEHDVDVVVDHYPYGELPARAEAEVAGRAGHDIFVFNTPPAVFEDEVLDLRDLVEEVQTKFGKLPLLIERDLLNPKTGKYFAIADCWVPNPVHYRADLWRDTTGGPPSSWDDVLSAAPQLKAKGFPVGLGMSPDTDSTFTLLSIMNAYGASLQDGDGRLAVNRPATVEAVKMAAAIYRAGMTDEIFAWDSSSNNRLLATGRGSLILNAISAIRAAEDQDATLAGNIGLLPALTGPAGRLGTHSVLNAHVIWRFAQNPDTARQFLLDLALNSREGFLRSRFYNVPAFPGAAPDLARLVAEDRTAHPKDKYAFLADAERSSAGIGHPGSTNAAVMDVFNQNIVPRMFAAAAKGDMPAEEAVKAAETQMQPIFDKWRERGKI
jgi:multiple sugar transport system substrate-binding protein